MNLVSKLLRLRNKWLFNAPGRFLSINIETNTICTRACSYCPVTKHRREVMQMPTSKVCGIIDELAKRRFLGAVHWGFYNEPMTDPRLPDFVDYAYSKLRWCRQTIYTNGDMFHRANLPWLLKRCKIIVSDHGNSREWAPWIANRPDKLRKRVWVSCPTPDTISSRGGTVESRTPHVTTCKLEAAIIAADGYMALCCNDYNYSRQEHRSVWKHGVFGAWALLLKSFYNPIQNGCRPAICYKCTESHVPVVPFDEWRKNKDAELLRRYEQ